jgi:hypothetical protein
VGKPAKFGDAFGDIMRDRVNKGVDDIRAKVAAKLGGSDPTGEQGTGAEEGGNSTSTNDSMELTPEEEKALDTE